jgi:hypothetical protein
MWFTPLEWVQRTQPGPVHTRHACDGGPEEVRRFSRCRIANEPKKYFIKKATVEIGSSHGIYKEYSHPNITQKEF